MSERCSSWRLARPHPPVPGSALWTFSSALLPQQVSRQPVEEVDSVPKTWLSLFLTYQPPRSFLSRALAESTFHQFDIATIHRENQGRTVTLFSRFHQSLLYFSMKLPLARFGPTDAGRDSNPYANPIRCVFPNVLGFGTRHRKNECEEQRASVTHERAISYNKCPSVR